MKKTLQEIYAEAEGDLFVWASSGMSLVLNSIDCLASLRENVTSTVVPIYPIVVDDAILRTAILKRTTEAAANLAKLHEALTAVKNGAPVEELYRVYGNKQRTEGAGQADHIAGERVTTNHYDATHQDVDRSQSFTQGHPERGVEPYDQTTTEDHARDDTVTQNTYTDKDIIAARTHTEASYTDTEHKSTMIEVTEAIVAAREIRFSILRSALTSAIAVARKLSVYGI